MLEVKNKVNTNTEIVRLVLSKNLNRKKKSLSQNDTKMSEGPK